MSRDEAVISVQVRPRSSRAGLVVRSEGELVIRVHAPAAEGAANRECAAVLAKALGVSKSAVRILRGERSRAKQIAVEGMETGEARLRLERAAQRHGRSS